MSPSRPLPILSISGYVKAGKDTLANLLAADGAFEGYHNIWWIKDETAATLKALFPDMPDAVVWGYVSTDHALKEIPIAGAPFNGRSSRQYQIDRVEAMAMEYRFVMNLKHRFEPRAAPLVTTGMRLATALTYWKVQAQNREIPLKFVWVRNPAQPPLSGYDAERGMYPAADSGFWDAVVENERGNAEGMLPQLCAQLSEVAGVLRR